ncbi:MAG: MoxR family ATPase [Candidatus Woesearchaeota archaeon]
MDVKKLSIDAQEHAAKLGELKKEIGKIIVGQGDIIEEVLLSLISGGHILLEGVPGLAKTLMLKSLAECINAKYSRIQFTPDLLPADITGTKIFNTRDSSFSTRKGPIFSNFILADEINRAPPKVQSALLEAMQEMQVTISGDTYAIEPPFFVMATQNPIETEGTYRLPEAQIDRFMFKLLITYPAIKEEQEIITRMTEGVSYQVKRVLTIKELLSVQGFVPKVYADDKIKRYIAEIVDATRHPDAYKLELNGLIEYGASPRASIWLMLAGKAHALLNRRGYVIPEDIKSVAHCVLRHRIITTYEAEAEGITSDMIIDKILQKVKVP